LGLFLGCLGTILGLGIVGVILAVLALPIIILLIIIF
jgi:hypothetical protein